MFNTDALAANMAQGWLTWLLTAIVAGVIMWGIKGILYGLGRDTLIPPDRRKFFYGIAGLFVFFGLLYAQTIHRQLADISAASPRKGGFRGGFILLSPIGFKSADGSTDKVMLSMSSVGGSAVAPDDKGLSMLIVAKIDNSGQPSVAWNWKTWIVIPGGSRIEGTIPSSALNTNAEVPTVIGPVALKTENQLIQALATNPLPTGAGKIGWLAVNFRGISQIPEHSHVYLSFEDVFGRPTVFEFYWTNPKNRVEVKVADSE